jgi:peptidoglycan/LPS O-acetylase OafA/YrhL
MCQRDNTLDAEPLQSQLGFTLGTLSVFAFFAISGFLIARSYERQASVQRWLAARVLRIFPGLAVVLLLSAFVLGPLVTTLPLRAYFTDRATLEYVPRNLSLVWSSPDLPGVFKDNPLAGMVNGSIWTLYWEFLCYGLVLVMGFVGAFRSWGPLIGVLLVVGAGHIATILTPAGTLPASLEAFLYFTVPFGCGLAFYLCRSWLPLTPWALPFLVAVAYAARFTFLDLPLLVLALSYGVFLSAYLPKGWVRRYNRLGDYSYGVYIYGWPVQQTVVHFLGLTRPMTNFAVAVLIVLALAWLSWNLIEHPALELLDRVAARGSRTSSGLADATLS